MRKSSTPLDTTWGSDTLSPCAEDPIFEGLVEFAETRLQDSDCWVCPKLANLLYWASATFIAGFVESDRHRELLHAILDEAEEEYGDDMVVGSIWLAA